MSLGYTEMDARKDGQRRDELNSGDNSRPRKMLRILICVRGLRPTAGARKVSAGNVFLRLASGTIQAALRSRKTNWQTRRRATRICHLISPNLISPNTHSIEAIEAIWPTKKILKRDVTASDDVTRMHTATGARP